MDREKLEARRDQLRAEREKALAVVHRINGALALLGELLDEMDAAPDSEPAPDEET